MTEVVVTSGAISSSHIITTNKPASKFLQARCPSTRPADGVEALMGKRTQNVSSLMEVINGELMQ